MKMTLIRIYKIVSILRSAKAPQLKDPLYHEHVSQSPL